MGVLITVAALTVLVSGLCSLFEATLYSTRTGALEAARVEGRHKRQAQRFIQMKKEIAVPTSAILVLNTLANTAGATACGMLAASLWGTEWVLAFSGVMTLAILFLGEILPKTYGATHWRNTWHLIVWPLTAMQNVLYPVVFVTRRFANFFTGRGGVPAMTEGEIMATIRMGGKSGELTPSEMQLLDAVFQFDEMVARQVMVPRREVVIFQTGWPLAKCLEVADTTQHTRYPLCNTSLDSVVGIVHIKDLVGVPLDQPFDIASVARPARHVPDTIRLSRLLREMQATRQHMAVIDDEYGTAVGLVTLENVVEQIVGAVQDEFDMELPEFVGEEGGAYVVLGSLPIERVNRELKLDLYAADADSMSGLLVTKAGRLLRTGDTMELEGVTAEVLDVKAGRATRIRLRLHGGDEARGDAAAEEAEGEESGL
jgi:CBS domain containing-hemolysin-like protein